MKEIEIINHYGLKNQIRKFSEESYELIEALFENNKKHITEEITDCLVLINQFKAYYEIQDKDIQKVYDYKDVYNSMPKNKHKKCYDGRLFKYRGLLFGIGHFRLINYKKTPQPQTINWILYIQEKNAWNKDINFNLYGCMLYDKNEPFAEHKGIINSINYYVRNKEVNKLIDKIIIKENSR